MKFVIGMIALLFAHLALAQPAAPLSNSGGYWRDGSGNVIQSHYGLCAEARGDKEVNSVCEAAKAVPVGDPTTFVAAQEQDKRDLEASGFPAYSGGDGGF